MQEQFIGAFDSGIGGLSVLKELLEELPKENFIYIADQKRMPYGTKSQGQIRAYSENITRFLLEKGAKCIVVPCNTASAAALSYLREQFPETPFIGIEPAVKPAAAKTKTGKIGVLATTGTFNSEKYASLVEQFAQGIEILKDPCTGLVELIEAGKARNHQTKQLLQKIVSPMIAEGIDVIVLGCTHYPFIRPLLEELLPKQVQIINPAIAVARHTKNRLEKLNLLSIQEERFVRFYTTGNLYHFKNQVQELLYVNQNIYSL